MSEYDLWVEEGLRFSGIERNSVRGSTVLWVILIVATIGLALIATTKRKSSSWGFKDVVKNPDYWDFVSDSFAEADAAVEAAKSWDDEQVAELTRRFILDVASSRDAWKEGRILNGLGTRTHPTVLHLLRDTSLYGRLVKPTGIDLLPEAPFNRACKVLGESPGPEAVEPLSPFLSDSSDEIRKDAALAIARTGAATITPLVRKAFSDEDEYVRSYALMGLNFALERQGLSDNVKAELFDDVLKLLRTDRSADDAAEILYQLNAEKAKEFYLSPEVLTVDSPILDDVLKVLANQKVSVPHGELKSLIDSLAAQELKYPKTYALGEALKLLGQHKQDEDRDFIRGYTRHADSTVAKGAAEGLLCSFGLDGYQQKIWQAEQQSGFESLTRHQQLYSAVFMCDAEINNGGLSQYFLNTSGDRWPVALAGFEAMGFRERLAVLKEAIAKFGSQGPATDHDTRQDQLAELFERDESIFEKLETRYYGSQEVVEVYCSQFVLENPAGFR